MNRSYSKIRHIQESNERLEKRLLSEQSSSLKNEMFNLLLSVDNHGRDGDALYGLYKKLLPYKNNLVQPNDPFKFELADWGQDTNTVFQTFPEHKSMLKKPMGALKFMDLISVYDLYDPITKKKVRDANPHGYSFNDFLQNVGDKKYGLFGGDDTTSDGKYNVKQLKQMITKLIG